MTAIVARVLAAAMLTVAAGLAVLIVLGLARTYG